MKYGQRGVLDIVVFDSNGNKVAELNSLKESGIYLNTDKPFVIIKDALLDTDILKFIGKEEISEKNDYEKYIVKQKYARTIVLGRKENRSVKLVGTGYLRESDTDKDIEFLFEIPSASVVTGIDLVQTNVEVSEFDLVFNIHEYNKDGDLIKMHIE